MPQEHLPVTVVVPIRNEAENLKRCLPLLSDFQEIVVVDSSSTDDSRQVAEAHGATFLNFVWDGTFPKKRNWVLRNYVFKTEWVLFVDADELVTAAFVEELRRVLPSTTHDAFWIQFNNYFDGRLMRHGIAFTKTALLRLGSGEYERIDETRWSALDMEIHEHMIVAGTTGTIASPVEHRDLRGIEHYMKKHREYADWEVHRYRKLFDAEGRRIPELWAKLSARQVKKYGSFSK